MVIRDLDGELLTKQVGDGLIDALELFPQVGLKVLHPLLKRPLGVSLDVVQVVGEVVQLLGEVADFRRAEACGRPEHPD